MCSACHPKLPLIVLRAKPSQPFCSVHPKMQTMCDLAPLPCWKSRFGGNSKSASTEMWNIKRELWIPPPPREKGADYVREEVRHFLALSFGDHFGQRHAMGSVLKLRRRKSFAARVHKWSPVGGVIWENSLAISLASTLLKERGSAIVILLGFMSAPTK